MARTDLRWRRCARALVSCVLAGLLALFLGLDAAPAHASGIRAYKVVRGHSLSRVTDVAQASNDVMWFTRMNGHRAAIGRLGVSGKVHSTVIPWRVDREPMLARGPAGSMWFTAGARLGRIDAQGKITSFPLPNPSAVAGDLAVGSDGAVWFIEQAPDEAVLDNSRQLVGRMDGSGVVTEYLVRTTSETSGWPDTIVRGPDGAMWFTEGTAKEVGRVDLQGHVSDFPLPGFCSGPCVAGSITAGNGAVWFANLFAGRLGRLTTSGGLRNFHVRGTGSGTPLRAITVGPDRAIWFASTNVVGRRTASGRVTRWRLGGSQGSAMTTRITSGPSRTVWVATKTTLYRVPVNLRKGYRAGGSGSGGR